MDARYNLMIYAASPRSFDFAQDDVRMEIEVLPWGILTLTSFAQDDGKKKEAARYYLMIYAACLDPSTSLRMT